MDVDVGRGVFEGGGVLVGVADGELVGNSVGVTVDEAANTVIVLSGSNFASPVDDSQAETTRMKISEMVTKFILIFLLVALVILHYHRSCFA